MVGAHESLSSSACGNGARWIKKSHGNTRKGSEAKDSRCHQPCSHDGAMTPTTGAKLPGERFAGQENSQLRGSSPF